MTDTISDIVDEAPPPPAEGMVESAAIEAATEATAGIAAVTGVIAADAARDAADREQHLISAANDAAIKSAEMRIGEWETAQSSELAALQGRVTAELMAQSTAVILMETNLKAELQSMQEQITALALLTPPLPISSPPEPSADDVGDLLEPTAPEILAAPMLPVAGGKRVPKGWV